MRTVTLKIEAKVTVVVDEGVEMAEVIEGLDLVALDGLRAQECEGTAQGVQFGVTDSEITNWEVEDSR